VLLIAFVTAFAACMLVFARPAFAQTPNASTAETLYDEGKKLMLEGKFAEACERFEESQRLDPGTGTLLNLANCLNKLGKTASAWAKFREAAAIARAAVEQARVDLAEKSAAEIESRLSKVRFEVPKIAGLTVNVDGVALGPASLATEIPLDPGEHALKVT